MGDKSFSREFKFVGIALLILLIVVFFSLFLACKSGDYCKHTPAANAQGYRDLLTDSQVNNVQRILDHYLNGPGQSETFNWLSDLTDKVGNRYPPTGGHQKALDYLLPKFRDDGFDVVKTEDVQIPNWIRGKEEAKLTSPIVRTISVLGLGTSVPTREEGLTGSVVVANSFEHADLLGSRGEISGKILVFNPPWVSYSVTGAFRRRGASVGSRYGAIATLIRSAASHSVMTPHTGVQTYEDGIAKKIPTACITAEDAQLIDRLVARGENVTIHFTMLSAPADPPEMTSQNVVLQLNGTEPSLPPVLISAHLDSWDVGEGAMDDGGGVAICREALLTLKRLNLRPKRSVRAVFFSGDEFGRFGSRQYYERHKSELFTMVMESDNGAFKPSGFRFTGTANQQAAMRKVMPLFEPINATGLTDWPSGQGVDWFMKDGIAGGTIDVEYLSDYYFTYHHTAADTVSVFRDGDLDAAAAVWTAITYIIADMDADKFRWN